MLVLKFGGTSVAGAERIAAVAEIIEVAATTSSPIVVVVSAFRGVTDTLLQMARVAAAQQDWQSYWQQIADLHRQAAAELSLHPLTELEQLLGDLHSFCTGIALLGECTPRMLDHVAAYGEFLSSVLIEAHLRQRRMRCAWYDARRSIITDASFTAARVDWERTTAAIRQTLRPMLETDRVVVTQGFIAQTPNGMTTTLGRGGSDYSAAILGAGLGAERIEIWTDVSGIFSADPRVIPEAHSIPEMTLAEVATLAAYGARVLHPQTIEPAIGANIPVCVRNTFEPSHPGTAIVSTLSTPVGGIRALTMLGAYAIDEPATEPDHPVLAAAELVGHNWHICRQRCHPRARAISLICCVGAYIHHQGTALEQIATAATSLGISAEIVLSSPHCILLGVESSHGLPMLEALHRTITTTMQAGILS